MTNLYQLLGAKFMKWLCRVLASMALCMSPIASHAYVECTLAPIGVYVDGSVLWVAFSNGGAGIAQMSDPTIKFYYASALAAFTSGRTLTVRYADGTACTANGVGMIGLWIK